MSRPPRYEQLAGTMFDAPDPPTGPASTPDSANSWQGYLFWRKTTSGVLFWLEFEHLALQAAAAGATRIGVKALVEQVRAKLKIECNNTYTAWLADDLVRRHPRFLDLVERRKRRKLA